MAIIGGTNFSDFRVGTIFDDLMFGGPLLGLVLDWASGMILWEALSATTPSLAASEMIS